MILNRQITTNIALTAALTCITSAASAAPPSEPAKKLSAETKPAEKAPTSTKPAEPIPDKVEEVTTLKLVDRPQDYLNKYVKFSANFYIFSTLALDYKPALRPSKTHLSFLVYRPNAKIPFSELKLAMPMPKEKDPENAFLTTLKDGDKLEIIGKVFSTALDEPWVDVVKVKKTEEKKDDKTAEAPGQGGGEASKDKEK